MNEKMGGVMRTQASRQSAKEVLNESLGRIERRKEDLSTLKRVIPWDALTEGEEAALWRLFIELRA